VAEAISWEFGGWDDAIAEIKRVTGRPGFRVIRDFERVFKRMADRVEHDVHVVTGSLKASGKRSTDYNDALSHWTGDLTYGGILEKTPHPGPPHDPVVYAVQERNRGGEHDFLRSVPLSQPEFEAVIVHWLTPPRGRHV
jgi:hypothetical protein